MKPSLRNSRRCYFCREPKALTRGVVVLNATMETVYAHSGCFPNPLDLSSGRDTTTRMAGRPKDFWTRVRKSRGCWVWTGTISPKGYGVFSFQQRQIRAHRHSYAIHFGNPGRLCVCHKCDNPSCVRPSHLFLGTVQDNNRDRFRKGNYARKVSKIATARIQRSFYVRRESVSAISRSEGLSMTTVYKLLKGYKDAR